MSNVICYNYDSSNNNNNTTPLDKIYQWDRDIMMVIKGLDRLTSTVKVHFANQSVKEALIVTPANADIDTTNKILRVRIPNDLLKESGDIFAYIYDSKSGGQGTTYRVRIPVTPRAKDGAAYVNDPSELNNGSFEIEELNITGNVLAEYITARKNITAQEHMYIGNDHVATEAYVDTAVDASSQTLNGRIDVLDGKIRPATKQGQGIVQVGDNISVSDGTISVPTATSSTKGVVRIGDNLKIEDGAIGVDPATKSAKGVVKVGDNISVNNGEISIPTATSSTKGVVKVGSGLNADNGEISVDTDTIATKQYVDGQTPDVATKNSTGVVQVGDGLNVTNDGVLSVDAGNGLEIASEKVAVKPGQGLKIDSNDGNKVAVKTGTGLTVDGNGAVAVDTNTIATVESVAGVVGGNISNKVSIAFVNSLPTSDIADKTIYVVPNASGGFDKWLYVVAQGAQSGTWEKIGGASTEVVTQLPSNANASEDVDYILKNGDAYVYYKWIDTGSGNHEWKVIGGARAVIVNSTYLASINKTLAQFFESAAGDEFTDYYVLDSANTYKHYRYFNGSFHFIGIDYSESIDDISQDISDINSEIDAMKDDIYSYSQDIIQDGDDYTLTLYRTKGDGEPEVVSSNILPATGGGSSTPSTVTTITVGKVTQSPIVIPSGDTANITVSYNSVDENSNFYDGSYTWTLVRGSNSKTVVKTGTFLEAGEYTFNFSKELIVGENKFWLDVVDDTGHKATQLRWTVQVIDLHVESTFNDRSYLNHGATFSFPYTPYGYGVEKVVHFKFDGVESTLSLQASDSGSAKSKVFSAPQTSGAHLVECWLTATIGSRNVESKHIYRDVLWYDRSIDEDAVIGCIYRNDYGYVLTARQYEKVSIPYVVYDPKTDYPVVKFYLDDYLQDEVTLSAPKNTYDLSISDIGDHTLKISCGDTYVEIDLEIVEIDIDAAPEHVGLAFDYNPTGLTNNSANKLYNNGTYHMSVSNNFDWINGGYKKDEKGDTYFLIKAGSRATFDYKMFKSDINYCPSTIGAEMKIVFMTENVQSPNAVWFTNAHVKNGKTLGIQFGVHEGWLKTDNASDEDRKIENQDGSETTIASTNTYLYLPYSEEDIIELDININEIKENEDQAFVMAYEDGVPCKAYSYTNDTDHMFVASQSEEENIVIGSDECDVRIYRLKVYSKSLTSEQVLRNFIADSRDVDTMIERYTRNSIYYDNEKGEYSPYSSKGVLSPERLAQAIPNVKVLMLEAPLFTANKNNFVKSSLRCIHAPGGDLYPGDPIEDNWYFENGYHAGQGTTSDNYGVSGRNVDFLFECDGVHNPSNKVEAEAGYVSQVTKGYGTSSARTESVTDWMGDRGKVSLTRNSVPNNFFNLKVNIASSENANNALLQKRYNDYLPYVSPAKKRDARIKNDMEFVPAVLFIRETDDDLNSHREFKDKEWHFYALGNLGDSKKTDYTRAYDPDDMNEFTIEVSDNTEHNSTFQTGVVLNNNVRTYESYPFEDKDPDYVYPITLAEWNRSNPRYVTLYDEPFNGDNSFEQRYACKGDYRDGKKVNYTSGTKAQVEAQIAKNEDVWRAFYRWIITATDEQFVNELDQWVVPNAVEYFYAFTHMYTMIDNRAKNTFWHFAKTGTYKKVSRPVAELLHVYCEKDGDNYTPTSDVNIVSGKDYYTQYAFDLWIYDMDTALGINNNGELKFPYGKEDTDLENETDPESNYAFNGAKNLFWCRLRDLLPGEIEKTITERVPDNCFSASNLIDEYDSFQNCFPEEIWRLDIERKYVRPFTGLSVDNSIEKTDRSKLRDMMQGRRKYQRRQWMRDQEFYFGTKYLTSSFREDKNCIIYRCYTPGGNPVVTPNYTLHLTPYSDMYLCVDYNNSDGSMAAKNTIRAKAGTEYAITSPLNNMDNTQVKIYGASRLSDLGDLSPCYLTYTASFSAAKKLKRLIIGNANSGYRNTMLTGIEIDNNPLIEEINIRNCKGLTGNISLRNISNLKRLYAEGSNITGVIFPPNGLVQIAHLPDNINTLSIVNLNNTSDFIMPIDTISYLTYSGVPVNTQNGAKGSYEIANASKDLLIQAELTGIDWTVSSTSLLKTLSELTNCVLTGTVTITGRIGTSEIERYNAKWPNLELVYDEINVIPQYEVSYVNDDANHTPIKNRDGSNLVIMVDKGSTPPDPVNELHIIDAPTKAPSEQYVYTFSGWTNMGAVNSNTTVTAAYTTAIRSYTVKWFANSGDASALYSTTVNYGGEAIYNGETPTDTSGENIGYYRLFTGWDKSTGFIKSNMDVFAVWEEAVLPNALFTSPYSVNNPNPNGKSIENMTIGEIYAIARSEENDKRRGISEGYESTKTSTDYFAPKDHVDITLGHDFNFSNVESVTLVGDGGIISNGPYAVDGNISTARNSELNLFGSNSASFVERSFTLAIDFRFTGTTANNTLLSCFETNNNGNGFRLRYGSGSPNIQWGNVNVSFGASDYRDIVVLRHVKGSDRLYIYASNESGATTFSNDIMSRYITAAIPSTTKNTLTIGAVRNVNDGGFSEYGNGIIYWCKLWYDDLGSVNSSKLASWYHEKIRMEYCGDSVYNINNSSVKSSASFIANSPLSGRGARMNSTNTSAGGWPESLMREWLNSRFINALPTPWQLMIKTVTIYASRENNATNTPYSSSDKIYLPSAIETGGGGYDYSLEGSSYSIFPSDITRIKYSGIFRVDGQKIFSDNATDPTFSVSNNVAEGDLWLTSDLYRIYIPPEKAKYVQNRLTATVGNGVSIAIDASDGGLWLAPISWWLRSKCYNYNNKAFVNVTPSGSTNYYQGTDANSVLAVIPCFSI